MEAKGFMDIDINGIYTFTGTHINGRHFYVGQNKRYAIWFDGLLADWVLGLMSKVLKGELTHGHAKNAKDICCPSLTKVWLEFFNDQWNYSPKSIVKCLSREGP